MTCAESQYTNQLPPRRGTLHVVQLFKHSVQHFLHGRVARILPAGLFELPAKQLPGVRNGREGRRAAGDVACRLGFVVAGQLHRMPLAVDFDPCRRMPEPETSRSSTTAG